MNEEAEAEIAAETRRDHERARYRGERIRDVADVVLERLIMRGWMSAGAFYLARVEVFSILADDIYGNAAIDVPNLHER